MSKIKEFFDIDISKDVFDVVDASDKLLKQSLAIAKSGLYFCTVLCYTAMREISEYERD